MIKLRGSAAIIGVLFLTLSSPPGGESLLAQTTTGSISGIVRDTTGSVLPGTRITIKHLDTGLVRTLVADEEGRYKAPNLPLGNYEVTAELSGFKSEVIGGIKLTIGREAIVDLTLQVGEITEKVVVAGDAPLVDTTGSAISWLVDDKKVRDLPLNGRDFIQLIQLQPGALVATGGSLSTLGGIGARVSIAGARPSATNFSLDGTDINDQDFGFAPSSAAGVALGIEAIREFVVITNNYSAEFGRSSGGIINLVTRSGTNSLHGSLFEFHRNSALDAKNFFDDPARPIPPFKRNQFGASAGGPLRRDKAFFFAAYEGLRESLGVTSLAVVPDNLARRGLLPDPASPGRRREVGLAPGVDDYLALFPLPTGREFGDGTAEFRGFQVRPTREDFFTIKIDNNFSEQDSLFGRYTFDDGENLEPFPDTPVPGFPVQIKNRHQFLTFEEKKIISNRLVNVFRFAYNRSNRFNRAFPKPGLSIALIPDPQIRFGTIFIFGMSGLGNRTSTGLGGPQNVFQFIDNLTYIKGRHSIKAGFDIRRVQINDFFDVFIGGRYIFNSLEAFLTARPINYIGVLPGSDSRRGWRFAGYAFFVQDDIKITSRLTLNLGLRYEPYSSVREANGKISTLKNPLVDKAFEISESFFENDSHSNFAPRIGFAWDPLGSGRTSLRGGFGVFYDQITPNVYGNARINPPFMRLAFIPRPPFPNPREVRFFPVSQGTIVDFHLKNPYAMHYTLGLQREILPDTVLNIGYVGSRGVHLLAGRDFNIPVPDMLPDGSKFFAAGLQRRNPIFGPLVLNSSDTNSSYNSLHLSVNKRFGRGFQFQVSYTFSRLIDEISGFQPAEVSTSPVGLSDPDDRSRDRGLSSFHTEHNLVLNYTYDLPFKSRRFGKARNIIEGWQLNGIVTVSSGIPFTPLIGFNRSRNQQSSLSPLTDRPNLRPGRSNNPILGGPDRYFDPEAFELQAEGFYGNLGRNTIIGPGLATFDLSLVKNNFVGEQWNLQFRAEFFNLFNRPNFATPGNNRSGVSQGPVVFNDSSGIPVVTAGKIITTVTTSRQIQFSLKLLF